MGAGDVVMLIVLVLAGVALIAGGVTALRRRRDWLVASMAVAAILIGASWLVSLIIGFASRIDPFNVFVPVLTSSLGLAVFAFWVIMLTEAATLEESNSLDKLTWVLIILLANVVGALIYFFARRPHRPARAQDQAVKE
ncbi:MAG: PLDc N-terminal domain-containing protein [Candidatus Bipolaricaulota bacterium]